MTALRLDIALSYAEAALAHGRGSGMAPISAAVVDAGGNLVVALRDDGAGFFSVDIAAGKARAALAFGCTSREIADALRGNPLAAPSVLSVGGGRLVFLPGGVLLREDSGDIVGAIGVAGDTPDNDEAAAMVRLAR